MLQPRTFFRALRQTPALSNVPPRRFNSIYSLPDFKPPPIRQRLRPLVPFFIYWCIITSLMVHLMRMRIKTKEDKDKSGAQISVLQGLIERYGRGEKVGEEEVQRELEMVGLRERTELTRGKEDVEEGRDVSWKEAIFGRTRRKPEAVDEETVDEWEDVVKNVVQPPPAPPPPTTPASTPSTSVQTPRAPSANVYI